MAMKYNVTFLPEANRNLLDIDEYLSRFYPSTAAKFFTKLDKKLLLLQEQPYIGAKYIPNQKYRRLVVDDYLAFYSIYEEKHEILIHRILHSSMDITRHL